MLDSGGTGVDLKRAEELSRALRENIGRVIKGQEPVLDLMVITIIAKGHLLLESVPGEGKTLAASALAASISGVSIGKVTQDIQAVPAEVDVAHELGIDEGAPVLRILRW